MNSRKIIDPILYDDILALRNELYSNLKEFFALTKLRKENHHVENDLNTVLQTYLYDFLYDQQDLYEEYDEIIQNKNYKNVNLPVRKMDLPFANSLQNLTTVLRECGQDRHYETLSKLRWYLCFGEETTKDPEKSR